MALEQGATIGIIGGGQLGRMLAMAAARLGFRTCILEPGNDCPAAQVANQHMEFAYDDEEGLAALAGACDVITYEFENVPVSAARYLEQRCVLFPPSRALELSQDRLVEKEFINRCGVNTARYFDITSAEKLRTALEVFGGTGLLKTRRFGYDGKGQVRFDGSNAQFVDDLFADFDKIPCILEELVEFECEISVIAARDEAGNHAAYDPAWNVHRDGILRTSSVPAPVSQSVVNDAINISRRIMEELSYVGVMGTEFFISGDGGLLVNEIAPRVHNSGHWTEAGCTISQFEQHIRAIASWPLGDTTRHLDCIMQNLIGSDVELAQNDTGNGSQILHLYGKGEIRPGRKMGHLTRTSSFNSHSKKARG